jgi:hypothetical protein
MSNQRLIFVCLLLGISTQLAFGQAPCPVEEDPGQVARGNLKLFCNLAERYMECFKTKTRNCIGGWVKKKRIYFHRLKLNIFRQPKVVLQNYKI